jgi:hypothetical protein
MQKIVAPTKIYDDAEHSELDEYLSMVATKVTVISTLRTDHQEHVALSSLPLCV